eukprot:9425826-Pyramimonas_sp.AAC.1
MVNGTNADDVLLADWMDSAYREARLVVNDFRFDPNAQMPLAYPPRWTGLGVMQRAPHGPRLLAINSAVPGEDFSMADQVITEFGLFDCSTV